MYRHEEIKKMEQDLLNKYKYCPKCNSKTTIETSKKNESFVITCSSLICDGLLITVDFNGEITSHFFELPEDENSYCGKCGDIIGSFGECSCNKYN